MPEFSGTKDLREYLTIVWRWKLLLMVFLVAAPAAAYLIERGNPKVYRSKALVGATQTTLSPSLLGGGGSSSTTDVNAIARLVTTTPLATMAAELLKPLANPAQIVREVSASADPNTNFVTISAVDRSPKRAAAIANAFAQATLVNLKRSSDAQISGAIKGIRAQLARLGPNDPTRPGLVQLLIELRAARFAPASQNAILQPAMASGTPAGPNVRRAVELGVLIGLLLGLGAVVVAENADRRLRLPDELETMADVPLLANIPESAFSTTIDGDLAGDEPFQMLSTALLHFNRSRKHQSIVVTSPGEQDGKTTVAAGLARAAARAGLNVVLVDADLRRPQIASRLGIDADQGLGAVLAGNLTAADVLVAYPMDEPGAGELRVLPAGAPPPNPLALVRSVTMKRLMDHLEARSDLVVVDTPAALMVSDPLPLIGLATGVILVARMNRSTREKIRRLRRMVSSTNGNLLGVVATGVSSRGGYGYYSSDYYRQNGQNGKRPRRRRRSRIQAAAIDHARAEQLATPFETE
jgi:capsular exopolysaccharide synthesis family protein